MKDSPNLDALRSCAVAYVVLSHLPYFIQWEDPGWYQHKTLGHVGVAIFFVHTTLVLMMSLERTGPVALPFLTRRLFRIFPLSMAVVLLISALQWMGGQPIDAAGVVSNLLLLQHVTGHRPIPDQLWTLSYEVLMYLFLPALFAFTSRGRGRLRVTGIYAGSLLVGLFVWKQLSFLAFIPCFLSGAIAFIVAQGTRGQHPTSLLLIVVAVAAMVIPALTAAGAPEAPLLWILCLTLGFVIPRCRNLANARITRSFKVVATYSYGIYLTHPLAMGLAFPADGSATLVNGAVFLGMLAALALLCYHWIERPGITLGHELARRLSQRRTSLVGG